jgi:hypothetical protein
LAKKFDSPAHGSPGAIKQAEDSQSQRAFTRPALPHEAHDFAGKNLDAGASQYTLPLRVINRYID